MGSIIALLTQLLPMAIADAPNLIASIKSMIASLSSSATVTPADLAQLQQLDTQCDAAFEAAAVADGAQPQA